MIPRKVEHPEWLVQIPFWAAHMWNVTRSPISGAEPEAADSALGVSADSIESFYLDEMSDKQDWPYFRISLEGDYAIEVEYANLPEDREIIYRVTHPCWPTEMVMGKGSGHWLLPALRWVELVQISQAVTGGARKSRAAALLLLFPAMWLGRHDDLEEVRRRLLRAWLDLDLAHRIQPEPLTDQLLLSCRSDVQWFFHDQYGWINDGQNSRRNPNSASCLRHQEFIGLRGFFDSFPQPD